MIPRMEAVPALHPRGESPPLAAARMRRQLTLESAAKLARLTPDEVTWLEEGKLYRFPSGDSATLALLLYSTALGIGRREAESPRGRLHCRRGHRGRRSRNRRADRFRCTPSIAGRPLAAVAEAPPPLERVGRDVGRECELEIQLER